MLPLFPSYAIYPLQMNLLFASWLLKVARHGLVVHDLSIMRILQMSSTARRQLHSHSGSSPSGVRLQMCVDLSWNGPEGRIGSWGKFVRKNQLKFVLQLNKPWLWWTSYPKAVQKMIFGGILTPTGYPMTRLTTNWNCFKMNYRRHIPPLPLTPILPNHPFHQFSSKMFSWQWRFSLRSPGKNKTCTRQRAPLTGCGWPPTTLFKKGKCSWRLLISKTSTACSTGPRLQLWRAALQYFMGIHLANQYQRNCMTHTLGGSASMATLALSWWKAFQSATRWMVALVEPSLSIVCTISWILRAPSLAARRPVLPQKGWMRLTYYLLRLSYGYVKEFKPYPMLTLSVACYQCDRFRIGFGPRPIISARLDNSSRGDSEWKVLGTHQKCGIYIPATIITATCQFTQYPDHWKATDTWW